MRRHIQWDKGARPGETVDTAVFDVPVDGYHYSARASAEVDEALAATLELRGPSGSTPLWVGLLDRTPTMIPLTVTLPGDRLVLVATLAKKAIVHLEVAFVHDGPLPQTGPSCSR